MINFFLASCKVSLWRFKDSILGPRSIPNYMQPTENNVVMSSETKFSINVEKKIIEYDDGQLKQPLGSTILYLIQ